MSERTYEIRPVGVEYVCDRCLIGTMVAQPGPQLTSFPTQVWHKCTECGYEQTFSGIIYPTIRYERTP